MFFAALLFVYAFFIIRDRYIRIETSARAANGGLNHVRAEQRYLCRTTHV